MVKALLGAAFGLALLACSTPAEAALYDSWLATVSSSHFSTPSAATIQLTFDNNTTNGAGQGKTYGNNNFIGGIGGEFRVLGQGASGGYETIWYANPDPADTTPDDAQWAYKTFCTEVGEHFSLGGQYHVTIDPVAYYGLNSRDGANYDTLSDAVKILYGYYFTGKLDDQPWGFSYESETSADALQLAIWSLEDSVDLATISNWTVRTTAQSLASGALAADAGGLTAFDGTVQVLNLWELSSSGVSGAKLLGDGQYYLARQSQLVYVPAPPELIPGLPEPTSLVLWGLLAGVAVAGRRRCFAH